MTRLNCGCHPLNVGDLAGLQCIIRGVEASFYGWDAFLAPKRQHQSNKGIMDISYSSQCNKGTKFTLIQCIAILQ